MSKGGVNTAMLVAKRAGNLIRLLTLIHFGEDKKILSF